MTNDELKRLVEATTPAPWQATFGTWPDQRRYWVEGPGWRVAQGPDSMPDAMAEANARFIAHAREALPDLMAEVAALKTQLVAMDAKLLDANPEIARLRKLIKDAEHGNSEYSCCPWCGAGDWHCTGPDVPHAVDCPAFMPDGTVR